ncbi:MAG: hypothetical protein GY795_23160 [Desulfobacterales bacterium]|nr:hypothetical protein [Desulfobacterales bacterium]
MMTEIISFSPPKKKESAYLMADYVELLCLGSLDSEISMNDAGTAVYHEPEYETARELEIEEKPDKGKYVGELKDRYLSKTADWFEQLGYRQIAFKEYYPFFLNEDRLCCRFDFTKKQLVYIFLLICSNLRIFSRKSRNPLANDFELISAKVLESYLPNFTVHHFGKSQATRDMYPNKLGDAIRQLANNLMERNICDPEGFNSKNTGDGGLDLVAWRRFTYLDDHAPGSLICLGQCACSADDWENKQFESHHIYWRNRINFMHRPANFIFVPICFRDSNGNWFDKDKIHDSILIDRLRICALLSDVSPPDIDFYEPVEAFYKYG